MFHGASSGLEACGQIGIWEMHNPSGTAREALGSDTQLPRLPSLPVKVTAVAVSDGDHFAWLKTRFPRGYENWDKVG